MESHCNPEIKEVEDILDTGIQRLRFSPIVILTPFVKMFFDSSSGLTVLPFNQLPSRGQNTLKDLCEKFICHIEFKLDTISTEDLLNWLRLIVYVEWPHLGCLMDNLCVNRGSQGTCNESLKKLLAAEEFRTSSEFAVFREHPILAEWTQLQKKESSVDVVSTFKGSNKRKGVEDSPSVIPSIRKRARLDSFNRKRED